MSSPKNKKLLFSVSIKDCRVEEMTHGGKGGQHANRNKTAIRITHNESGAVGESRDFKSQIQNKRAAWERLAETKEFKKWHKAEVQRRLGTKDIKKNTELYKGFGSKTLRTYTLSGKKKIRDHKTLHTRYDVDRVMAGDIDSFIIASANIK